MLSIVSAQEKTENISASKARYVARTTSIEIEKFPAPAVRVRRVIQLSSRGSTPLVIIYQVRLLKEQLVKRVV